MLIYQWLNRSKDRFYKITVQSGDNGLVLDYHWGSCVSSRGGKKTIRVCSEAEAQTKINAMMKRRKIRGYELIAPI